MRRTAAVVSLVALVMSGCSVLGGDDDPKDAARAHAKVFLDAWAAGDLANKATQLDHDGQAAARAASLDLIWVAFLIDAGALDLDPHRSTTS